MILYRKEESDMAIFEKKDLACYIIDKYKKDYDREISPIKLQKALYFLFAMWGGKIADAQREGNEDTEDDDNCSKYERYLFDASFEAWRYGPVDRNIYTLFKNKELICESCDFISMFDNTKIEYIDIVKGYVDDILTQIFNTNDFSLVDLSHEDKCWKDAIKKGVNTIISKEDIIRDYQN